MSNSAHIGATRDVTEQVLDTLDTLRQRLAAARMPDDASAAHDRLPLTLDTLRDTHADLLDLAAFLRAALDDLNALEAPDATPMDQEAIDDISGEIDDLGDRIDHLMDELRDRRSRDHPSSGDGQ